MKVFKFGGASVNSVDRVKNLADILRQYPDEPLMIIISAMGKTTNALEKVTDAFYSGKKDEALALFSQVKEQHLTTAKYLLVTHYNACEAQLRDFFTEVEWMLHDKPVRDYDYYYDQVVCTGELYSTAIVSAFLAESGLANQWLDVRDIIRTDDDFRDADIDWAYTTTQVQEVIKPALEQHRIVITQGFIGSTDENESTTLGREGSDYTAAVFANLLDAKSLSIWKDVEGVMNADPKQFPDAVPIAELSYNEVIEMAYYGAQVIHPKTIKPLQNKNIPLHVKCFLDPSLPGTVIHNGIVHNLPPIIVLKDRQVMLEFKTTDFSFIGEQHVGHLYQLFGQLHIKPNLTQNGAIHFTAVFDDRAEKIERLALSAADMLDINVNRDLQLLTIRHFNNELLAKMTAGKEVLLRQQTKETVQVLMRGF